jgi:hypothetical protein
MSMVPHVCGALHEAAGGCERTPCTMKYTFQGSKQPPEWSPYCYINPRGCLPGAETRTLICSVLGCDTIHRATSMPFAGRVSTNCNGRAFYGSPAWNPAWYRASLPDPDPVWSQAPPGRSLPEQ